MNHAGGFEELKKRVIDTGLCARCGLCQGICPVGCIELKETDSLPRLNGKCVSCGKCVRACPGRDMGMFRLKGGIGDLNGAFVGHATDIEVRSKASSGGVITALLTFAMENADIDSAVIVGKSESKPWVPEARIARTPSEIKGAMQSKYAVVPNLRALRNVRSDAKLAVVGLPCQINGITKADMPNVKLKIGLYCGLNTPLAATEFLMRRMGVKDFGEIKNVEHRGREWPGGFLVTMKNGREMFLPKFYHNFIQLFYTHKRCFYCPDFSNELSDISVGDAWIPEYLRKGGGHSLMLARTDRGLNLIRAAEKAGVISIEEISKERAHAAHEHMVKLKVWGGIGKISLMKKLGFSMPEYSYEDGHYLRGFFLMILFKTARVFRFTLRIVPLRWWGSAASFTRKLVVGEVKE